MDVVRGLQGRSQTVRASSLLKGVPNLELAHPILESRGIVATEAVDLQFRHKHDPSVSRQDSSAASVLIHWTCRPHLWAQRVLERHQFIHETIQGRFPGHQVERDPYTSFEAFLDVMKEHVMKGEFNPACSKLSQFSAWLSSGACLSRSHDTDD